MSWGFNEISFESSFDVHLTTPAGHEGITFIASSGDNGAKVGAEYPSSSADVLAVGGTTLKLDGQGDYVSETAWNGSGRGDSRFEAEPRYQVPVQSSGKRRTPDVVFDGNPKTGVAVYETPLGGGAGTWQKVGGTSLGTPAWAAIMAIVDQGRALAGEGSLDGPTQTLPALYRLPASDFHSVGAAPRVSASSPGGGFNPFGFLSWGGPFLRHHTAKTRNARSGPATSTNASMGLGSPNGPALISDLVASQVTVPMTTTSQPGATPA